MFARRLVSPTGAFCCARAFSTSQGMQSMVGRSPIMIPPDVKIHVAEPSEEDMKSRRKEPARRIIVSGPLGTLTIPCPLYIDLSIQDSKALITTATPEVRKHREMWGTIRSHVQNLVTGVSEGHTAILRLVGVGYRATIEDGGKKVGLKVGYSHPVELTVPKGVKASTPQPTRILLEGANKEVVKQFAADIRKWREPEPYKGKGIFIDNEEIKLKAKKVK